MSLPVITRVLAIGCCSPTSMTTCISAKIGTVKESYNFWFKFYFFSYIVSSGSSGMHSIMLAYIIAPPTVLDQPVRIKALSLKGFSLIPAVSNSSLEGDM